MFLVLSVLCSFCFTDIFEILSLCSSSDSVPSSDLPFLPMLLVMGCSGEEMVVEEECSEEMVLEGKCFEEMVVEEGCSEEVVVRGWTGHSEKPVCKICF